MLYSGTIDGRTGDGRRWHCVLGPSWLTAKEGHGRARALAPPAMGSSGARTDGMEGEQWERGGHGA